SSTGLVPLTYDSPNIGKIYKGNFDAQIVDIDYDAQGNVYAVGNSYDYDFFSMLLKFDEQGHLEKYFFRNSGGPANGEYSHVKIDAQGNLIVSYENYGSPYVSPKGLPLLVKFRVEDLTPLWELNSPTDMLEFGGASSLHGSDLFALKQGGVL